jgi:hypothetical protein
MQPRPILTLLVIELIAQLAWRAGARGVSLGLEGGFLPAWEAPFADAALASFWLAGLGLVVVVGEAAEAVEAGDAGAVVASLRRSVVGGGGAVDGGGGGDAIFGG